MGKGFNQFVGDIIGGARDIFVARENRRAQSQVTQQAYTAASALASNDRAKLQLLVVGGLGLVVLLLIARKLR